MFLLFRASGLQAVCFVCKLCILQFLKAFFVNVAGKNSKIKESNKQLSISYKPVTRRWEGRTLSLAELSSKF